MVMADKVTTQVGKNCILIVKCTHGADKNLLGVLFVNTNQYFFFFRQWRLSVTVCVCVCGFFKHCKLQTRAKFLIP